MNYTLQIRNFASWQKSLFVAVLMASRRPPKRASPSTPKGGLFAVALFLNLLLATGLVMHQEKNGAWAPALRWLKGSFTFAHASRSGDDGKALGPVVHLPDTVVRLQGYEDLYVEASFDLEVSIQEDKDAVSAQMPRMHEATIEVLSKLNPEQLRGSRELEKTKRRLLSRLRKEVPSQSLRAVYVSRLVFGRV